MHNMQHIQVKNNLSWFDWPKESHIFPLNSWIAREEWVGLKFCFTYNRTLVMLILKSKEITCYISTPVTRVGIVQDYSVVRTIVMIVRRAGHFFNACAMESWNELSHWESYARSNFDTSADNLDMIEWRGW